MCFLADSAPWQFFITSALRWRIRDRSQNNVVNEASFECESLNRLEIHPCSAGRGKAGRYDRLSELADAATHYLRSIATRWDLETDADG